MHDGILIGEGVVLDARPASFFTRALGGILDALATFAVLLLVLLLAGLTLDNADAQWAQAGGVVLTVALLVGIPVTVETLSRGRSLGKLATGVRVVRDDGGPVRFRHALIRALVGVAELWISAGGIALIASLANAKGKRLGDMVAGTYAIRVRGGKGWQVPLSMPPELAGWAALADMRRLPDGLALAARQLIDRAPRLAPSSRIALADELAARVEPFVAPLPPPGTPAEAFLHAVLHERRDRELARGLRERERAQEQAQALHRLPYAMGDPTR
ncbi:RDD domain containing protein [Xylanimonas cellulosilytica DSM 15894]|uniref:RDD domain containing protein n=1 Tax=Xylanimonas cellulosilytica (strain DSM 15894 / JCM 12276 / CECT 5975 / KCTC 9989 / LMG 20990 / NBRC 107835 / XIL07) TaxID=446471 RepID=D1BWJ2_XYLCX|nr:RDD family protein [Xylanimonas cellulosilytica]ACZ31537.1 RDD domain containing protein [Xylanimonas cellulosilytica DSM 15894]